MTDMLRGEIRKLVTTRTALGMLIGAVLVVALGTVSTIMSIESGKLAGPIHDQMFYFLASITLGVFTVILGIRSFTEEFRYGTIASTFLIHPRRRRVLVAKSIVSVLASVVMTIVSLAAMVGLATALAGVKDGQVSVTSGDFAAFGGLVAGMAVWAILGTVLGAIIRHQVAAVVAGLVWVLVVENMAGGFLGAAARFTPGQAVHSLANVTQASSLSSIPSAGGVLIAYLLVGAVLAVITLERRDAM